MFVNYERAFSPFYLECMLETCLLNYAKDIANKSWAAPVTSNRASDPSRAQLRFSCRRGEGKNVSRRHQLANRPPGRESSWRKNRQSQNAVTRLNSHAFQTGCAGWVTICYMLVRIGGFEEEYSAAWKQQPGSHTFRQGAQLANWIANEPISRFRTGYDDTYQSNRARQQEARGGVSHGWPISEGSSWGGAGGGCAASIPRPHGSFTSRRTVALRRLLINILFPNKHCRWTVNERGGWGEGVSRMKRAWLCNLCIRSRSGVTQATRTRLPTATHY